MTSVIVSNRDLDKNVLIYFGAATVPSDCVIDKFRHFTSENVVHENFLKGSTTESLPYDE